MKKKQQSSLFREPEKRIIVITIGLLLTAATFIAVFYIILQSMISYNVDRYTDMQQSTTDQLKDTLFTLYNTGSDDKDVIRYIAENVPVSGSSYCYLIKDHTILFVKNESATADLEHPDDSVSFLQGIDQPGLIHTTQFFHVNDHAYQIGRITDRNQALISDNFTASRTYLIMIFAILLFLFVAITAALSGLWTKNELKIRSLHRQLVQRNQEFEKLHSKITPLTTDEPIAIHHHGHSGHYKQYKFKFYLNARHAIFIDGVLGAMHPHTWEITLHVIKMQNNFIQFNDIEKKIDAFMSKYQDQELNSVDPFDTLNPTLENCCNYYKDQIQQILNEEGWLLLMIEMSETPSRSYVISLIEE